MNHNLIFRLPILMLTLSVTTTSCGDDPPSFVSEEPDDSGTAGEPDLDSDADSDVEADSNTDSDTDSDSDTDTDADTDSDSDTDADGDTDIETDSESGIDSEGETDSKCVDPTGHDEDGDGVADQCDNCPSVANPGQANGKDDDDLGNVCEAKDRVELLERVALFEPFITESPEWTGDGGEWRWLNDDVVQGSAPAGIKDISGYYVNKTALGDDAYAVEATFVHDQGGNSQDWTPFAGVVFAWAKRNDARKFWVCLYDWSTRGLSLWRTQNGSIERSVRKEPVDTSSYNAAIWRRVRATWDGKELRCEFNNEIGDFATVTPPQNQIWNDMSGKAGLRVYNETSTFSSFVIYK